MKRRDLVALFWCALLFAGVETYSAAPATAKDGDQGGSGNSDGGRGNSDGGRGNSDGGRGNSDGGRGNSDGGRGNSGGAGGVSDGGRGNSDGGRGNSGGAGGVSDGGRGNSGGGRGAADHGGGTGPDSGARSGTSDAGRGAADPGGRAGADSGARSGNSQGGARGRTGNDAFGSKGWGTTSPERAREAVSHGWALPLSTVLPTVSTAVPGQVLEVDLRQTWTGEWHYDFLVLTMDRRYREVVVDARRNQVLQVRRR